MVKQNTEKPEMDFHGNVAVDMAQFQQVVTQDMRRYFKLVDNNFRPRKYNREQVRRFLENPGQYERQLREVSHWMMIFSMHYRRLLGYFSTMLTLDFILAPVNDCANLKGTGLEVFRRNYERSSKYLENFNVKHELGSVEKILLSDGVYYGYERQQGNSFMLQRLPTNYCRIIGRTDGIWTYAFNFDYFAGNESELDLFPEEFREMYAQAISQRKNRVQNANWIELDSNKAVCMKFDEDVSHSVPPLVSLFDDIVDLEDYKDMNKNKTKLDNYKLIVQKIPMKKEPKSEKDYVLTLPTVKTFHDGIKSAVPEQVGVISTPMDLIDFDFEKARQKEDNVGQAERNIFNMAGVSAALFNSEKSGSVGLNRSIDFDLAYLSPLLRQFERYFKKRLNQINGASSPHPFKVIIPEITIYNRKEMFDKYFQAAQYGLPTALFAVAALGISSIELGPLASFQNDFLKLPEVLIPLTSSHTLNASGGIGGRPQKDGNALSDSGVKTKDGNKNANRAK